MATVPLTWTYTVLYGPLVLCVMARQSAISGILRNMSLLNTRLPGLLPEVECTPACMVCIAIDDIPYIFIYNSNLSPYVLYIYFLLATCPHLLGNVSPCIWKCVPMYLEICPHVFGNLSPCIWKCVPMYLEMCPHIFGNVCVLTCSPVQRGFANNAISIAG